MMTMRMMMPRVITKIPMVVVMIMMMMMVII